MALHDRAYTRAKTWSKAIRKYHIDRDRAAGRWEPRYNNLHQFADNKIHCSCPLCSAKTNNKHGRASYYGPPKNWSISDHKKLNSIQSQLGELYD